MEISPDYETFNYTSILRKLEEGDRDGAMELFWQDISGDWITYIQIMTRVDYADTRLVELFDQAMDYYLEKEEYRKCKRIRQAREFLEFRRADP